MQTYIAILRGINVSGQKMMKMDDLKKLMEELPFKNVRTYIQSGNIIFDYENTGQADLAKLIEVKIEQKYRFQVPVIVLNNSKIETVLKQNSFINLRNENIDKLYVTFLSENPQQEKLDKLTIPGNIKDEFVISGDLIYLFCPDGYGNTKLNNNFFEQKLKVTATIRNWKTVIKLSEMSH